MWPIVEDAFKIVIWYLDNWPSERENILQRKGIKDIEYKIPKEEYEKTLPSYKAQLQNIWDISVAVYKKPMLCPGAVEHIIGRLALLAESFQKQITTKEILDTLENPLRETDIIEEYRQNPSFESFTAKCKINVDFVPVIPILGNQQKKSTGISINTHVEQYLKDIPASIGFFNVLLEDTSVFSKNNPKKGYNLQSKKQPHYGNAEGCGLMYLHDLYHRSIYCLTWLRLKDLHTMYIGLIRFAARKREEIIDNNDKQIIMNGIFMLYHESFRILYEYCIEFNKLDQVMSNPILIIGGMCQDSCRVKNYSC